MKAKTFWILDLPAPGKCGRTAARPSALRRCALQLRGNNSGLLTAFAGAIFGLETGLDIPDSEPPLPTFRFFRHGALRCAASRIAARTTSSGCAASWIR